MRCFAARPFLLLLLLVAGAACAEAQVRQQVRQRPYDIQGRSWQDLLRAMQTHGPDTFFALTRYQIDYTYRLQRRLATCTVEQPVVTLDTEVILPRWLPDPDAPYDLRRDWQLFHSRLEQHERTHQRFGEQAAREVLGVLHTFRGPCDTADAEIQRRAQAIMDAYDARNRAYDQQTGHGRTEGAVWPLPR